MLRAAAHLTLDICEALLSDHLGLKDASPYNILFDGPKPIHVDTLSFERRSEDSPLWLPFSQFMYCFVNPLIVNRLSGIAVSTLFGGRMRGLSATEALRYVGMIGKFTPLALTQLIVPSILSRLVKSRIVTPHASCHPIQARFVLKALFRQLRRTLLKTSTHQYSHWSSYGQNPESYSKEQNEEKFRWVRGVMGKIAPKNALDIGSNDGRYSFLLANAGARVVSVDSDPAVVDALWRLASAEGKDILPLVVDFTSPTPATGWRGSETLSFLDRVRRGRFDTVVMLAMLHHLMVTGGVPLVEITRLMHELTSKTWIVELVLPSDPMFKKLSRGRRSELTQGEFERTVSEYFNVRETQSIAGSQRTLYWLERKG